MLETSLIVFTGASMIVFLLVSLVPFVPGPAILWAIAVVFAILNDFERLPIPALVVMSILMLIGSTADIWLRMLGMQRRGGSCWAAVGSLIGGLLATFLIPVPILGTLIGAIAGALLVEFMRMGELSFAMQAGRSVIESYLVGIVVEFTISLVIVATFFISIYITA
jgi:hypothetical protein